jgi:hypothetical protein
LSPRNDPKKVKPAPGPFSPSLCYLPAGLSCLPMAAHLSVAMSQHLHPKMWSGISFGYFLLLARTIVLCFMSYTNCILDLNMDPYIHESGYLSQYFVLTKKRQQFALTKKTVASFIVDK